MQGWIAIHRKFMDSSIYKDSQAVHLWLHLLLRANHQGKEVIQGLNVYTVERGQILTGRKALSTETGINESKIQRLLKVFEKCHMIEQQTNNVNRLISILKYDDYQASEQQMNNKRTASEQQVNTNNNDNNDNNEKNNINIFKAPTLSEVQEYCKERGNSVDAEHFLDHNETRGWFTSNGKKMKCWKSAVRTWEKYQGRFNSNHDPLKTGNHGLQMNRNAF